MSAGLMRKYNYIKIVQSKRLCTIHTNNMYIIWIITII